MSILPSEPKRPSEISEEWNELYLPIDFREHINHKVIEPIIDKRELNDVSLILFGPPGTGKTSIPKAITKEIGWSLYELGPKDFIGDKSTEENINECFREIECKIDELYQDEEDTQTRKQKENGEPVRAKLAIIFDEIDELVISRDPHVDRQSRFATTLMLPLFNNLRKLAKKKGALIFVLTNHIERFDPAIKRLGRFDMIVPIGPPHRQARYLFFENSLEKLRSEYLDYNIDVRYLPIRYEPGILVDRVDFDILARTSRRLGFEEIKQICRDVIDQKILMQSKSIAQIRKMKSRVLISLETKDFTDWITKYRNLSADVQAEIERFYNEFQVYSRGSTPYLDTNSIQDRINQEFDSLNIKQNTKFLKQEINDRNWGVKQLRHLTVMLRNLAEHNRFEGILKVKIKGCGIDIKDSQVCRIAAGKRAGGMIFKLKPSEVGKILITFDVEGRFIVGGMGQNMKDRKAEIKGSMKEKFEISIE